MPYDDTPQATLRASMKASLLNDALALLAPASAPRSTIPILTHCAIETDSGKITLTTTDFDCSVSITMPVGGGHQDASACIPLKELQAMAKDAKPKRKGDDNQCIVECEGDSATLHAMGTKKTIAALPKTDWPELRDVAEGAAVLETEARDMLKALDSVSFAMSSEETRYYLQGAYLHAHEGEARFVATDGHRMAVYDTIDTLDLESGVIIPRETVSLFQKALRYCVKKSGKHTLKNVQLSIEPDRVALQVTNGIRIVSKTIDGTFPDYARVIPKAPFDQGLIARRGDLETCAKVFAKSEAVKIDHKGDEIALESESRRNGIVTTQRCTFQAEAAGHFVSGFNPVYLAEALKAFEAFEVRGDSLDITLQSNSPGDPALMTCDASGARLLAVLMPLRV